LVINTITNLKRDIFFVKKRLFIKSKKDRLFRRHSHIPNSVVLTVKYPEQNLDKNHIKKIKTGKIS
jgi:hypothetical protein